MEMDGKQITFRLKLPNDEIIHLPTEITTIHDVYIFVKCFSKDELILYYKNIPIPDGKNIKLIDIGYDPYEFILMKPYEVKECEFKISKYDYIYLKKIPTYQKAFEIKDFFAKEFHTIAQNIIIKKYSYNSSLKDDEILTENGSLFEIDVIEGFSLYYVFFSEFYFICLPNTSSFNDLKYTLAGYHKHYYTEITLGTDLNKALQFISNTADEKIQNHISKLSYIDFNHKKHDDSKDPEININIESWFNQKIFEFKDHFPFVRPEPKYLNSIITCFLEKKKHVDRECFMRQLDRDRMRVFSYYSLKRLYVKINNKNEDFPYLITIKELRAKYGKINQSIGFIINGIFAYKDDDFVARYLGSINNDKSRLQITIIKPSIDCRLCQIQNGNKTRKFIIPLNLTFNEIANIYYKRKSNSMQFFSGFYIEGCTPDSPLFNTDELKSTNSSEFHVCLPKTLVFNYYFEPNKQKYKIEMSNERNLQIKDLLYEIAKEHKIPFHTYDAYIKDKRIDFWELAIEYVDQELIIKTYEYQDDISDDKKYIKVFDNRSNAFFNYRSNIKEVTAENLIETITENVEGNFSLYLNFHKLEPKDKPILLFNPYDFLFLSENSVEKEISISNDHGIEINDTISFESCSLASVYVLEKFKLDKNFVDFKLIVPKHYKLDVDEFILPFGFDAGSFPTGSKLLLDYRAPICKNLTFEYSVNEFEKITKKVTFSDPNKSIQTLKKEIINNMKIFKILPRTADFEFLGNRLNPKKHFSNYGITENSSITIKVSEKNKNKFVEIRLFDESSLGKYYYKSENDEKDTIKNIAERLKKEYEIEDPDYYLQFYGKPDYKDPYNENRELERKEILYASFEKISIKILDISGKSKLRFDEIIKPTEKFIEKELLPKIPDESLDNLALFSRESRDHYTVVDSNKTFRENGNTLYFLLPKIADIKLYFNDNEISFNNNLMISTFESIQSFINIYLKDKLLSPPEKIKLYQDNIELNGNFTLDKILGKKTIIKFSNDNINMNKSISKKKLSLIKPKRKPSLVADVKKSKSKDDDEIESDYQTYTFVIKDKEPFEMALNKDATIENAMEKIAEKEHVDINDVSIIYAGKEPRRSIVIAKMFLNKRDFFDVMISDPMET